MLVQSKTESSEPLNLVVNCVTASSSMLHWAATMVEPSLSTLPTGMRRFMDAVKFLAVVPATMMPMTPMVKLYSLLHQSMSGWGSVMPTTPGRVAINRKIEEVRTMGMHPRNPSLMAWR